MKICIIGSGHIGAGLARAWRNNGHDVGCRGAPEAARRRARLQVLQRPRRGEPREPRRAERARDELLLRG
ncbi:MAG: NAD(P)-binding domain-containing protein [Deltaproteobacteria bacterium]|nr:NAD(P)-binding domain-containing protein [Deltaproteobacteria bacterium]